LKKEKPAERGSQNGRVLKGTRGGFCAFQFQERPVVGEGKKMKIVRKKGGKTRKHDFGKSVSRLFGVLGSHQIIVQWCQRSWNYARPWGHEKGGGLKKGLTRAGWKESLKGFGG